MSDITREQYDNAVKIRDNGYACLWLDVPCDKSCDHCAVNVDKLGCGQTASRKRIANVDLVIDTYQSKHLDEFYRESFPEAKPAPVPSASDWKVYLCLPQNGDPFHRETCTIVDIGHSDHILNVECTAIEADRAAQRQAGREEMQEVLDDYRRLTRELDVALNGDGAAKQASLCDIVAQVKRDRFVPEARYVALETAARKVRNYFPQQSNDAGKLQPTQDVIDLDTALADLEKARRG